METFTNALSRDTIDTFKQYFNDFKDEKSLNDVNQFGIDVRTIIRSGSSAFEKIKEIVKRHMPDVDEDTIYANYQRQVKPTFMHVDEYGTDREQKTWTIIIPMHDDPRLRVVLFKNFFNTNNDLKEFIQNFDYENSERISEVSKQVPLSHTPNNWKNTDQMLVDYMDLAGVFEYKLGDYVLFDTNVAHVSSDFTMYPEYKFKDLVQMHFGGSKSANKMDYPYHKKN